MCSREAVAALLLALVAGCRGTAPAPPAAAAVERIAVLPFDNQSSDAASNWMGSALARLVASELSGSPAQFVYAAGLKPDALDKRPARFLEGTLTRKGEQWRAVAYLRDAATHRTLRRFDAEGQHAGALADRLAAQLGKPVFAAAGFAPGALEAWGRALVAPQSPDAPALARRAVEAQPDFADAALLLAQLLLASGDRAGAVTTLESGAAKASSVPGRARLAYTLAAVGADPRQRLAALQALSAAAPADADAATEAASLLLRARQYPGAVEHLRRALRADPENALLYNDAAFAHAFSGDYAAARAAIDGYRQRDPKGANPDDSLGEILCMAGRFEEAGRAFLAAFDKDASFLGGATLRKAAEARRMGGQTAEADRIFARYAEVIARAPAAELIRAQWQYTSGQTHEAAARLEAFAAQSDLSAAWTQLAAWRVAAGGNGAEAAQRAWKSARNVSDQQAAAVALFVSQPDVDAKAWTERAARQFPAAGAPLGRYALAHALMLRKHYAAAVPLLRELYESASPVQAGHFQVLLAWAIRESGQAEQAKPLLRTWPIPRTAGDATYDFLTIPRIVELYRATGGTGPTAAGRFPKLERRGAPCAGPARYRCPEEVA